MSSKTELEQKVIDIFAKTLGYSAEHLVQAPGRVNLIGEHTDYNDGFVMPCAINYQTVIAAARRDDNIVRVYSVDYDQFDEFDVTQAIESVESKMWANYIRGVVKHLLARGYQFGGADIAVSGNVPQGAGLSSSAALEVVVGQCFKALYQLDISQQDIALVGQEAENQFVGCNCGIMDQLISAKGATGQALLIDCRSLETELVSLPQDVEILIINSNKKRGLVDSEYNTRREQCESAAASFGVKALRDVNIAQFEAHQDQLDPVVAMRARHVITENQRTEEAAVAMQNNDMVRLAELMAESHASMRDDFEITVKEIDAIVDMVKQELGTEGGVRMTGGGFGGCVVALVPPHKLDAVLARIEADYEPLTGLKASTYICQPMSGAGSVELISTPA